MYDLTKPLKFLDILGSPGLSGADNNLGLNTTRALIVKSIKRIYTGSVSDIFSQGGNDRFPRIPAKDIIPIYKSFFRQFGAIYEDEGTIEGYYSVYNNIFL